MIFSFPGDEEGEAFDKKHNDGDDARDQRGEGVIALIHRVKELENGQLTLGVDEKDDGARRRHAAREVIHKAAQKCGPQRGEDHIAQHSEPSRAKVARRALLHFG